MNLRLLLPYRIFSEVGGVTRIVAETAEGSFGILPHRRDCVAALAPGILTYSAAEGEVFVAIDEGILVKTGARVRVSVRNAIAGTDLRRLRDAVTREFLSLDEHERTLRMALTRMESGLMRSMVDFHHE